MILIGINFPPDVDEIAFAGLTARRRRRSTPPRIDESPCAMECRVERIID